MSHIFVTGISTEVGKTVASAVLVEALGADYWKPVQAGDLDRSDSMTVGSLLQHPDSMVHPNAYALNTPMSPHAAAALDGIHIELDAVQRPSTDKHLVIEGAGGLLVPLNETDTIADLIFPEDRVVVVSRHYLGSINHSLLTLWHLQQKGLDTALIFVGDEHPSTESIIVQKTGVRVLGRLPWLSRLDAAAVHRLAEAMRPALASWLDS